MTCLMSISLTFIGHMLLVFFMVRYLDRNESEAVCNEAINGISGEDFYWSLTAVFTHVTL
jgi:hypothetical protein